MPRTRAPRGRPEAAAAPVTASRRDTGRLVLKPGREKSVLRRHPWLFSGAIEAAEGAGAAGETVKVVSSAGRFLAWAAFSPSSQIRARVWSFEEGQVPGPDVIRRKLEAAVALRRSRIGSQTDAVRLVHAESDGLPGLIADRYADVLVVQLLSTGAERWRAVLLEQLAEITGCGRIYERSDGEGREMEGLPARQGWVLGPPDAEPMVEIGEHGLRYGVDVANGQKTGFYLDQRDNRARVGELSEGREVLNCFCYTGGFTLSALAGGARSVLSIDSSGAALKAAQANVQRNALGAAEWMQADVFRALRELLSQHRQFDLIVLDPPKFAPTPKDAERAARGYKDINLNALRLLRPGGLLATFSCSGGVSAELFQKIVAGAAADAPASLLLRERRWAAPDHPVLVEFPEGEYLKGLLLERL
jgi:23S rRNA (cytosine1962-C5)-methyltransferase